MVDISAKAVTFRTAIAQSKVRCSDEIIQLLTNSPDTFGSSGNSSSSGSSESNQHNNQHNNQHSYQNNKGDVFAAARIAGIQAAKKCSDLIPLCHPLPLSKVSIDIRIEQEVVIIDATCKTDGKTGVEMEALTAASIAALTLYDMCKAIDKGMIIESTRLLHKTGGKSGDYSASDSSD